MEDAFTDFGGSELGYVSEREIPKDPIFGFKITNSDFWK